MSLVDEIKIPQNEPLVVFIRRFSCNSFLQESSFLRINRRAIDRGDSESGAAGASGDIRGEKVSANVYVGDGDVVFIPKEQDSSPSAGGRSVGKGAKSMAPNVSRGLVVDEVELSLLDACNVASGLRESGMHRVFPSLIIQPADVPADNVKKKA
jgi:hypothetical protein